MTAILSIPLAFLAYLWIAIVVLFGVLLWPLCWLFSPKVRVKSAKEIMNAL